jgi:hypothetical protein
MNYLTLKTTNMPYWALNQPKKMSEKDFIDKNWDSVPVCFG